MAQTQAGPSVPVKRYASFIPAILLFVISFCVYANSISNGFVLDDSTMITNNTLVTKGVPAIPELLVTPYRYGFKSDENDLYRPLSLMMFAAEYQLFDGKPEPMHLVNVLLFACCVLLLFSFMHRFIGGKPAVAFICALLFSLHPIHTEVVDNIKSRDELLCFFFAFACLNLLMRYVSSGKGWQLICGAFCFLCSFLAKETAVSFVFIVPVIFFFYKREHMRRSVYVCLSVLLVAIGVLAARFSILNHYHSGDLSKTMMLDNVLASPGLSFETALATRILIMGHYLWLLIVPYPLVWDYSYNVIPLAHLYDPFVLLSLAAYIFLAVYSIKRVLQRRNDQIAFGILYFLLSIALFSNAFFLVGVTLAERFLFLPSAGFCLVAGLLIYRLAKSPESILPVFKQPRVLAVLVPLCVCYALMTFARNRDWKDNYTLYSADVKKAPNSARINYLLGDELILEVAPHEADPARQKQVREEGIAYLKKALSIYPDYMGAENYLGYAYLNNQEYDSAVVHGERAMTLDPANTSLLANLAGLYVMTQQYAKGITAFRKLIAMNPNEPAHFANLGVCYGNMAMYDSSLVNLKRSLVLDPTNKQVLAMLATTYKVAGQPDSARKYEQAAGSSSTHQ